MLRHVVNFHWTTQCSIPKDSHLEEPEISISMITMQVFICYSTVLCWESFLTFGGTHCLSYQSMNFLYNGGSKFLWTSTFFVNTIECYINPILELSVFILLPDIMDNWKSNQCWKYNKYHTSIHKKTTALYTSSSHLKNMEKCNIYYFF
jgi:hypothetical protein